MTLEPGWYRLAVDDRIPQSSRSIRSGKSSAQRPCPSHAHDIVDADKQDVVAKNCEVVRRR
jgi:hypothetical protein